ncbi:MAG TPA: TetR/AcrR family transcriptional regulator [Streptosporangiaceae bacterium]|nr:TetR/AcrR family transcriptional regulator [Streptosporangiaceae bacterium]
MIVAMPVKPSPSKLPLRDRRRAAVERIALDLALEHGYDAVTVEMICDAVLISQSTFFNYFGSKDRAVLGPEPAPLDEHRLAAFAAGHGDVLTELMQLIVANWPDAPAERELLLKRLDLTERTPALHAAHIARLDQASEQVERAAVRRLGRDREADTTERAKMLVSLSHAAMHWMIGRLRVEPAVPWPALVSRAVAVLRNVAGETD